MAPDHTPDASSDPLALGVQLECTRALLWIKTPADARNLATDLVTSLGGAVGSARDAHPDAIPVDISFGDGEPLLPVAPSGTVPRLLLERRLPSFVEDVRRALELAAQVDRLAEDASIDPLTRLPNRRMVARAMSRLRPGGVVIMLDLDHFKQVNDTLGHAAGDQVLRALGRTLRSSIRGRDVAGRYGGEEFVILLGEESDPDAFLTRLRQEWSGSRPHPVTFSAGLAVVGDEPRRALEMADAALYRAKVSGRDQWMWAEGDAPRSGDDSQLANTADGAVARDDAATFVAFSLLDVPDGSEAVVDAAFSDRLRAVDQWPGFRSLEVWVDEADPGSYAMVSWWDSHQQFRDYMASEDHQRSHDRIPTGADRPRPVRFRRFRVVSR